MICRAIFEPWLEPHVHKKHTDPNPVHKWRPRLQTITEKPLFPNGHQWFSSELKHKNNTVWFCYSKWDGKICCCLHRSLFPHYGNLTFIKPRYVVMWCWSFIEFHLLLDVFPSSIEFIYIYIPNIVSTRAAYPGPECVCKWTDLGYFYVWISILECVCTRSWGMSLSTWRINTTMLTYMWNYRWAFWHNQNQTGKHGGNLGIFPFLKSL